MSKLLLNYFQLKTFRFNFFKMYTNFSYIFNRIKPHFQVTILPTSKIQEFLGIGCCQAMILAFSLIRPNLVWPKTRLRMSMFHSLATVSDKVSMLMGNHFLHQLLHDHFHHLLESCIYDSFLNNQMSTSSWTLQNAPISHLFCQ